jgi:cytochrome c556
MKSRLVLVLLTAWCLAGRSNDAARHKEWMDAAQDVKDDLKDALDAKLAPKAVECAGKLTGTAKQEEAYWKKAGQKDALGLARQFRAASLRIEAAAKAARFDQALQAYGNLAATCRACHDLHPEKRLAPNPR